MLEADEGVQGAICRPSLIAIKKSCIVCTKSACEINPKKYNKKKKKKQVKRMS